ncbi:MAG: PHP domain-containing protein [Brevinematia bacterium]
MSFVDLHIHSTFSDGLLTPEMIVETVRENNVPGFSLTDHDTFDGVGVVLDYLRRNKLEEKIIFIKGCEFSSYRRELGEVHIIGYFFDDNYKNIYDFTREFQVQRAGRAKKIIECLNNYGYEINEEDVFGDSKTVGRLNIARSLVKKGFFKDIGEAFEKMLKDGAPCYFKKKEVSPEIIIQEIVKNKGKAVLAHPTFLNFHKDWSFLYDWIKIGLWGIECYHPKISGLLAGEIIKNFTGTLVFTGGSDFHGDDENIKIGQYGISVESAVEIFS